MPRFVSMNLRSEKLLSGSLWKKRGESPHTLWVPPTSELVLLIVGSSENPVTKQIYTNNSSCPHGTQFYRMEGKIPRLEGVCEWDPCEVSDGEHEPKTIGGDVHGCE